MYHIVSITRQTHDLINCTQSTQYIAFCKYNNVKGTTDNIIYVYASLCIVGLCQQNAATDRLY